MCVPVWILSHFSFSCHLISPSLYIRLSLFRPWEYEFPSEPQISDRQDQCCDCVRSPLMCGAAQTQAQSILAPRFLPPSLCFFSSPSPPLFLSFSHLSFWSAVFDSKGGLLPLQRPGLISNFQIPVFVFFTTFLLFTLFFNITRNKHNGGKLPYKRRWGLWEAEASVALKWERTSLISNLKLPCSHLWPSLNSLTQAIHSPFTHTKTSVFTLQHL